MCGCAGRSARAAAGTRSGTRAMARVEARARRAGDLQRRRQCKSNQIRQYRSMKNFHALFREPIDVWRLDERMQVTAEVVVHVIDRDEEDVELFVSRVERQGEQRPGCEECAKVRVRGTARQVSSAIVRLREQTSRFDRRRPGS